ncbi:MAG: PEGA domain-containing protein [Cystobacterineae bacterium]|nr:PEGA domain-containing protein [Cystobacterineae bacterium]
MRFAWGLSLASWACISTAPPSVVASWEQWEKENKSATERGNLFIHCEPEDAEVVLDGIPQGNCLDYVATGLRINRSPHLRKIVVTKAGYWPYEAMVAVDSSKMSLHVQLQPMQINSVHP